LEIGASLAALKQEIAQGRPFSGLAEEALLNLLRSADCVHRAMQRKIRPWGVTSTQYNVLRILRGSHPQGLTCSAIGDRMITAEPDITRLLRRLKGLKLIRQERDQKDKRVTWTQISSVGMALLGEMDPVVQQFPQGLFGHLGDKDLATLIRLLELARKNCQDSQEPVSCTGQTTGDGASCAPEERPVRAPDAMDAS
jgi:DNA-binding MarR family transcriptional regulator